MKSNDIATLQSIAKTLESQPLAIQRTLAKNAQISPGLMNAILKRFVERGWIMLSNVNKRKLAYALTDAGIAELTKRGKNFIARTFKIANTCNEVIFKTVAEAKEAGKSRVVLYGNSYIKFLLEYSCRANGMDFEVLPVPEIVCKDNIIEENVFCIAGEMNDEETLEKFVASGCVSLMSLVENLPVPLYGYF